jgi:hypothetical protein
MNPGLAQGFVRFSSVACHVLRYLHEHGPSLSEDIARNGSHTEAVQISATLIRLRQNNFVFTVGRDRKPGKRSHTLYDIEPRYNCRMYVPLMTGAEKSRNYRERLRTKVSSVFDFRGQIPLG